ncbi:MAG: hypothetical protein H0T79_12540, partial [Deltaproteobacteria bacterium]|nr:hypothetical protein [Deltaproteobacteria bacterium]
MLQRTGVLTFAIALATTSIALAKPAPPPLDARAAAEKLEREARDTSDLAKYAACGKAYLDLSNANPKAAGGDELLYNAAVCFESGKSIGAALQTLALLRKSYPTSRFEARALARQGAIHARIGSYDEAASRLEEYARKYPGEKDAADALSDATYYRLTFGPDAKAIANVTYASKLYGARRPAETAAAMFSLIGLYERTGGGDPLIAHLRSYLRNHAPSGGPEKAIIATAKLGEALWHQACPIRQTDGLCVKFTRERPIAKLGIAKVKLAVTVKQCGPTSTPKVVVVPRDAGRTKEALQLFAAATRQFESRGVTDPAALAAVARARIYVTDAQLEPYLALGFPKGLNFDPEKRAKKEASLKRFNEWVAGKQKLGGAATAGYEAVFSMKEPTAAIAAAARLGQLSQAFGDALHGAEIPADVRTGEFAADKIEAFCDKMTEVAEPLYARAAQSFGVCATKASELGIDDSFARLCVRELALAEPKTASDEVFATPGLPTAVTLEPAIRTSAALSPAFQTALAKVVETERTGWATPACRAHAAQFAAITKANPT